MSAEPKPLGPRSRLAIARHEEGDRALLSHQVQSLRRHLRWAQAAIEEGSVLDEVAALRTLVRVLDDYLEEESE